MSDLKTFYKHASHYLAGRMGMMLLSLISFSLFTRIFSVADYGIMGLVLKMVVAFVVLAKLGMQNAAVRFYHESQATPGQEGLRRYYSTLLLGAIASGIAVTLAFALGISLFPARLVSPMLRGFLLLGAVLILIRSAQQVVQAFFRIEERTVAANAIDLLTKGCAVAFILALFFLWQRGLRAFFIGTIVAETAVLGVFIWPLVREGKVRPRYFDFSFLRMALAFAMPMIAFELTSVIIDSIDRVLALHYLGAYSLGLYSAAYNIAAYVQQFVFLPIGRAFSPIFMRLWATKGASEAQAFLNRSIDSFLMGALGMVAAIFLTARDTVSVLASSKYQEASPLLPLLVTGLMINALGVFFGRGLFIYCKTVKMAILVATACLLNIVLNIALIPAIGLKGAAIASLASYAFLAALMYYYSSQLLPMRLSIPSLARCLVAGGGTFGLVSIVALRSVFASFAVRGALSVTLYGGIMLLLDSGLRQQAQRTLKALLHAPVAV